MSTDQNKRWKESPMVVALYDYLSAHSKRHRFWMIMSDGKPTLRMNPGLTLAQRERWEIVAHAECLLRAALPYLMSYVQSGDIVLPVDNFGSFCG